MPHPSGRGGAGRDRCRRRVAAEAAEQRGDSVRCMKWRRKRLHGSRHRWRLRARRTGRRVCGAWSGWSGRRVVVAIAANASGTGTVTGDHPSVAHHAPTRSTSASADRARGRPGRWWPRGLQRASASVSWWARSTPPWVRRSTRRSAPSAHGDQHPLLRPPAGCHTVQPVGEADQVDRVVDGPPVGSRSGRSRRRRVSRPDETISRTVAGRRSCRRALGHEADAVPVGESAEGCPEEGRSDPTRAAEARERLDQGGDAGAVGADQGEELPGRGR